MQLPARKQTRSRPGRPEISLQVLKRHSQILDGRLGQRTPMDEWLLARPQAVKTDTTGRKAGQGPPPGHRTEGGLMQAQSRMCACQRRARPHGRNRGTMNCAIISEPGCFKFSIICKYSEHQLNLSKFLTCCLNLSKLCLIFSLNLGSPASAHRLSMVAFIKN